MKRACDSCISRKVRCDGAQPCRSCLYSSKNIDCTYLKPARKRGPKTRRISIPTSSEEGSREDGTAPVSSSSREPDSATTICWLSGTADSSQQGEVLWNRPGFSTSSMNACVSEATLAYIIREYQHQSYSVWPVVKSEALLERLRNIEDDPGTYCLATALCAATMAQLDLPAISEDDATVDSSVLASECIRIREQNNYREHLDLRSVLASFFLHVYHAKVNKRNSALMFIQEAISCAKLLRLDHGDQILHEPTSDLVDNGEILFPLLWISERGYATHLGLSPSYTEIVRLPDTRSLSSNVHVQGLLELARLFVTFAQCFASQISPNSGQFRSADMLITTEALLHGLSMRREEAAFVRLADYYITKEWMRTIIWQQALSSGLLSSNSYDSLMTFTFPSYVGRDLLRSLKDYSHDHLLPLGRDQILKCFEVANSLADTLLCNPSVSNDSCFRLGPQEFLHGLYQKLSPFLEQDPTLNMILRQKTAEALLRAPSRLWTLSIEEEDTEPMDSSMETTEGILNV